MVSSGKWSKWVYSWSYWWFVCAFCFVLFSLFFFLVAGKVPDHSKDQLGVQKFTPRWIDKRDSILLACAPHERDGCSGWAWSTVDLAIAPVCCMATILQWEPESHVCLKGTCSSPPHSFCCFWVDWIESQGQLLTIAQEQHPLYSFWMREGAGGGREAHSCQPLLDVLITVWVKAS